MSASFASAPKPSDEDSSAGFSIVFERLQAAKSVLCLFSAAKVAKIWQTTNAYMGWIFIKRQDGGKRALNGPR